MEPMGYVLFAALASPFVFFAFGVWYCGRNPRVSAALAAAALLVPVAMALVLGWRAQSFADTPASVLLIAAPWVLHSVPYALGHSLGWLLARRRARGAAPSKAKSNA